MARDNSQVVRDFYQAFAKGDLDTAISCFDNSAEFKVTGMEKPFRGQTEIGEGLKDWAKTFPDMKVEFMNLISQGDYVVIEAINRGTHKGPLHASTGTVEPTGRRIAVQSCDVFRISNGKITAWTCYWPNDVMMGQLQLKSEKLAA